jgi:hypothetical protein
MVQPASFFLGLELRLPLISLKKHLKRQDGNGPEDGFEKREAAIWYV